LVFRARMSRRTRLFVGRISTRTRERDLEDLFSRYGRIRDVVFKGDRDFAFVEFDDDRDASDAKHALDDKEVDGSRLTVEYARGPGDRDRDRRDHRDRSRDRDSYRDRDSRGGRSSVVSKCFNCNQDGHWARDCPNGDWSRRCFRCGESGHRQPDCRNSPLRSSSRERLLKEARDAAKKSKRSRSRSRSKDKDSKENSKDKEKDKDRDKDKEKGRSRSRSDSRHRSSRRDRSRSPAKKDDKDKDAKDKDDKKEQESKHDGEDAKENGDKSSA